jgi:hypothetical protein
MKLMNADKNKTFQSLLKNRRDIFGSIPYEEGKPLSDDIIETMNNIMGCEWHRKIMNKWTNEMVHNYSI